MEQTQPMKSFLEEVADDLYTRYGDALSACRILFPSRLIEDLSTHFNDFRFLGRR